MLKLYNNLKTLDLSNCNNFTDLLCNNNKLEYIDLRNGNNTNIFWYYSLNNPDLYCVDVDDVSHSNAAWFYRDVWTNFSWDCSITSIEDDLTNKRTLLKITNAIGQEIRPNKNTPLFYLYNDGTVERGIIFE